MFNTVSVFVYGTLRPPRSDTSPEDSRYHAHITQYLKSAEAARLPGAVLYDLGSYPGIVRGNGTVHGDLLMVKPAGLTVMDRIEGHPGFFKREKVNVDTDDRTIKAWVYWAPKPVTMGRRCIANGDWLQRDAVKDKACPDQPEQESSPVDAVLQALVDRFAQAECSWFSSVKADGRPHSTPVWHVWHQGRAYVVTTANAVKTANISANPAMVIAHHDPFSPVIIEGWGTLAPAMRAQLQPLFKAKYDWDLNDDAGYDTIIEVMPLKLMAWGKSGEGRWFSEEILRVEVTPNE